MEPWTSHGMSRLKFEILFDHTFYHSLSYFFIKVMIIWSPMEDPTFKRRYIWIPELLLACHVWNQKCFLSNFSHSLSYLSWRSWWFENILSNTRHLEDSEVERRKIWSLELPIACHVWNSKSLYIILFSISNHIHHDDNENLILFCQIQNIWRILKSKEGR